MAKKRKQPAPLALTTQPDIAKLLLDVRALIEAGRSQVAQAVNTGMVLLYWAVGNRVRHEILGDKRATYGEQIIDELSRKLTAEYGRGFGRRNLFHMVKFAENFAEREIVQTLSAQLGWSHFIELLHMTDTLKHHPKSHSRPVVGLSSKHHGEVLRQ